MPGYSKEDGNILKPFGAAVKAGRDGHLSRGVGGKGRST